MATSRQEATEQRRRGGHHARTRTPITGGGGRDDLDPFGPMAEGLATALQCYEDSMGEKMMSLVKEQSALLEKLESARKVGCCMIR